MKGSISNFHEIYSVCTTIGPCLTLRQSNIPANSAAEIGAAV